MSPRGKSRLETARDEREDVAAQEVLATPAPNAGVVAPTYIRAVHPDHGEAIVFVPGELLPEWAAEALKAGEGKTDADGILVL